MVEQGYSSTQTEDELEVVVPLSSEDVTAKDLSVTFRPQNLQVFQWKEPVVSLPLFERVDVDACTWTLDRGSSEDHPKRLVITMEKCEQALWPRIRD